MLFDSHAHLDVEQFDEDRDELIKSLFAEKDISYVMNPGVNLETSSAAIKLAQQYPGIYAAVGFYPQEVGAMTEEDLFLLEGLAKKDKVVAIGEIGLDYYWEVVEHDVQQYWFRRQIQLAIKLGKPICIHDREAHGDVMQILKEEKAFENTKVLMHCYSGSAELARQYLKLGCYFSIAGPVTYKNSKKAPEIIAAIPLDHMCVETDSPYLTPMPLRGRVERNDPANVKYTVQRIADFKGVSYEEVALATCETAKKFYGIED